MEHKKWKYDEQDTFSLGGRRTCSCICKYDRLECNENYCCSSFQESKATQKQIWKNVEDLESSDDSKN